MDIFFQKQSFINTLFYQHFIYKLLALEIIYVDMAE